MFNAFVHFYLSSQLAPLLRLFSENNTFGPRSRYRKKLPAAANQFAENKKNITSHAQIKK